MLFNPRVYRGDHFPVVLDVHRDVFEPDDPILAYNPSAYYDGSRGKLAAGDVPANGGQVATWLDLIDPPDNATQTTGANQPLDDGDHLYFDGAGDFLEGSSSNGVDCSWFIKAQFFNAASIRYFMELHASGYEIRLGYNAGIERFYVFDSSGRFTGTLGGVTDISNTVCFGFTYEESTNEMIFYVNGVEISTETPSTEHLAFTSFEISRSSSALEMDCYSVLSFDRTITPTEVSEISTILMS